MSTEEKAKPLKFEVRWVIAGSGNFVTEEFEGSQLELTPQGLKVRAIGMDEFTAFYPWHRIYSIERAAEEA